MKDMYGKALDTIEGEVTAVVQRAFDLFKEIATDAGMERPEPWAHYSVLGMFAALLSDIGEPAVVHLNNALNKVADRA